MKQLFTLILGLLVAGTSFAQKGFIENPLTYQPTPKTYQKVSIELGTTPTAELVRGAILERIDWLGDRGYDLALEYERTSPYSHHFTYHQTWEELPIYHQNIKANVGTNGKIYSFLNNLIDLNTSVQVAGEFDQAETAAISFTFRSIPHP